MIVEVVLLELPSFSTDQHQQSAPVTNAVKLSLPQSRSLVLDGAYACAAVLTLLSLGCGNRAHSDLYQQRMAGEIRVLEDQLYDADYQNRVLNDKLQAYQQRVESTRIPTPSEVGVAPGHHHPHSHAPDPPTASELTDPSPLDIDAGVPVPTPDPNSDIGGPVDGVPVDVLDKGFDTEVAESETTEPDISEPEAPDFLGVDMGEPVASPDAKNAPAKKPTTDKVPPPPIRPAERKPLLDPSEGGTFENLPPPPGMPMPPGKDDLLIDPIVPGDIAPPAGEGSDEKPPGQILLPENMDQSTSAPERIRIHPALSVGHHDGETLDGATLIVSAVDRLGRNVDLNQFDVAADLSVVVLDPKADPAEAKLGRWDFSAKEVEAMLMNKPISGIEIPIRWKDVAPTTDKVIVHVRLRGDEDEMRTQSQLDLRPRTAASTWTPRAQ